VADFAEKKLTDADLTGTEFRGANLTRTVFRGAWLNGTVMRGAYITDFELSGEIGKLTVNGVDVGPLVEAELNRRYPERARMKPADAAGFREAWDILERLWAGTVERARRLDPALLHASVGGEWSFIQTQRHLVYATDAWVRRAVLGDPAPWDPLDLPWDEAGELADFRYDRDAQPTLDEVLALRRDRQAGVRELLESLTDEKLKGSTQPVRATGGWPHPTESYPVAECLGTVLNEEWEHRLYAERDLAVLEQSR
jgi:hypothetical protein